MVRDGVSSSNTQDGRRRKQERKRNTANTEDLIPDLLVEIVTSLSLDSFALYLGWMQDQLDWEEAVIKAVVDQEALAVVKEASLEVVQHYLATEIIASQSKFKGDDLALDVDLEIL